MSYLLNLIRGTAIEFFYLEIGATEMKKTTQNEYKHIINKEKIIAFNFFNTTLDFEFEINLFFNVESLYFESIMFNSLSSYSFISKCSKLHKLYFKNCNIKYLSSLINTSNIQLKSLTLDSIDIIDDVNIGLMTTLEELNIIKSRLTRIGNLCKLQNLRILNLENNSLINIDDIENLSLLEEIYCNNNQITQLWNLEKTPLIKKLVVSKNNITNVNDLIKLKNLEIFEINLNPIKYFPNLLSLQHLNYDLLKVDWNQIQNIEGMKGFGLIKNIIKNLTFK